MRDKFWQPRFPLQGRTFSEKENNNLISLPEVNHREQLHHILVIQGAINNLNFHIDCLVDKAWFLVLVLLNFTLLKTLLYGQIITLKTVVIVRPSREKIPNYFCLNLTQSNFKLWLKYDIHLFLLIESVSLQAFAQLIIKL